MYLALLMAFCVCCGVWLRSNLGVGIVCMVNRTAIHATETSLLATIHEDATLAKCIESRGGNLTSNGGGVWAGEEGLGYSGSLEWTHMEQSQLFSAFFYGRLMTIGWSGWLADRYSPKALLVFCIADLTLFNYATPLLATTSYPAFWAARFVMGLGDGILFPCLASMLARWFRPTERSTAAAIYTSGNQVASTLGVWLSAQSCNWEWGLPGEKWGNVFYIPAVCATLWLVLWVIFASSSPTRNRFIGTKEREYLASELAGQHSGMRGTRLTNRPVPWMSMFSSSAVMSLCLAQFSFSWSNTILQAYMPSYYRDVMLLDLSTNGLYTALPFISQLIFKNIFALTADWLKATGRMSISSTCKALQGLFAFGSSLTLLLLITLVDCETPVLSLVLMTLFGAAFAGTVAGAFTASLCIAPPFTGTVTSLCLFCGALANIAVTNFVGVVGKNETRSGWNWIFATTVVINALSGLFFLVFGTAEVQPWARVGVAQTEKPRLRLEISTSRNKVAPIENSRFTVVSVLGLDGADIKKG